MARPVWCNLCNRNVVPTKDFNWLVFIFLCGVLYLPIYWLQGKKCPICQGRNFSPAAAGHMGQGHQPQQPVVQQVFAPPQAPPQQLNQPVPQAPPVANTPKTIVLDPPQQASAPTSGGSADIFCPSCGSKAAVDDGFCTDCGGALS
ncbi:MAG: hypothetical protein WC828_08540 [Thermoleophilia bacterium]